ncbi:MAG: class I SAM-dependent methyltransferase [Clostridia bacterium]
MEKCIHLTPRLSAAADMLLGPVVADIGADHGRLAAALIQSGRAQRVIASDISESSLSKARMLAEKCALSDELVLRIADGLCALTPGEADSIAILGMGGTLIAKLLESGRDVAMQAKRLVLSPMRAADDLRYYLFHAGYDIVDEKLVLDSGRYYQLIAAKAGVPSPLPSFWPQGMYSLGPMLYQKRDPLLPPLVAKHIAGHQKRLSRAKRSGSTPEALLHELDELTAIQKLIDEGYS